MKEYKVGDTVYVKGKITDVDHNETMLPFCIVSSPNYHFWASQESVIDELPVAEPVKPVLPKGVADELETTKKLNVTFDAYIMRVIDNHYLYTNSHTFWINSDDGVIKILMDAWYNGYTVEPEKKFLVKIPHVIGGIYRKTTTGSPVTASHRNEWLNISKEFKSRYEFTDEEITKFDLQDCEKELVADDSED